MTEAFDDGEALHAGVCDLGLEDVVAKRVTSRYGARERGWVTSRIRAAGAATQNEALARSRERRARTLV